MPAHDTCNFVVSSNSRFKVMHLKCTCTVYISLGFAILIIYAIGCYNYKIFGLA